MEKFLCGIVIGIGAGFALMGLLIGTGNSDQFKKEAFRRGYMEKKINSKDEVIYVWKENYE